MELFQLRDQLLGLGVDVLHDLKELFASLEYEHQSVLVYVFQRPQILLDLGVRLFLLRLGLLRGLLL